MKKNSRKNLDGARKPMTSTPPAPQIDDDSKELERDWLVPILNGDNPEVDWSASRRVLGLLKDLLAIDDLRSELGRRQGRRQAGMNQGRAHYEYGGTEAETIDRESQQLLASINRRLECCHCHPVASFSSFNGSVSYSFWCRESTEAEFQENLAVTRLLDHMSEGKIGCFRLCTACSRWFIADTARQNYCSTECRVRNHSESQEFKGKGSLPVLVK